MCKPLVAVCLCLILTACLSSTQPEAGIPAVSKSQSTIFYNGVILTMEAGFPQAQAIAIQDQKILAVGQDDEILALRAPGTRVIDLQGRTLMPGFVDAHTHILNDARSQGMSLDEAQARALRNGITTLGDLFVDRSFLREIRKFEGEGRLRVRTGLYLVYNDPCGEVFGDWYKDNPPTRSAGEMLRINGVKIFTDGGSCGRPALSFEIEKGAGHGDLWMSQDQLNQVVREAQSTGYQVAIHAIGDRAVEQAQNAIAFALDGQPNQFRHRMEHISVLTPEMVRRFGELGIIAVIPGIYPSCTPFGPPLPKEYGSWEWPWRDLRAANPEMKIAWHSDFPFWSTSPILHLYGFVTRKDVYLQYDCSPQVWLRDDTLSVEQALTIMTIDSAYALFREDEVGSLEAGKYADLIVLSQNPLTIPPEELKRIQVLVTLVNGQFEYCAAGQPDLCPGYANRVPEPLPDLRPPEPVSWLIAGLVVVLPAVFIRGGRSRRKLFITIAGAAGILTGLLLFGIYLLTGSDSAWLEWANILALVFLILSASGMTLLKRSSRGIVSLLAVTILGAIIAVEAAILSVWLKQDSLWPLLLVGGFLLLLGLLLFGLANLKARIFPRLNWVPLAAGLLSVSMLVWAQVRNSSQLETNVPMLLYLVILGSGWVVMGILLLLADPPSGG